MRLTGKELAIASQGEWVKDTLADAVEGIGTDTRNFIEGEAFLALRGPNFDGHNHAHQVVGQAVALIGDSKGVDTWGALAAPQLKVQDTLQSLGDIANFYRNRLTDTKVVAITGSYGKTTVRSMLEHVLVGLNMKVMATQANLNNLIGVPKTLLGIKMDTDIALIECGISEKGEMLRLSEIVEPDAVVVTGLSHAHGEGLGGMQGIATEKAALMTHLSTSGWVVLGQGVAQQFSQAGCLPEQPIVSTDDGEVTWQLLGKTLHLQHQGQQASLNLLLPAKHWAEDMVLAATVVLKIGDEMGHDWSLAQIGEALASWHPVAGRLAIHTLPHFTLIDDAYNANPASMQAALDTLAKLEGHRIAILGDMLELGDEASTIHTQLDVHNIDEVLLVGDLVAGLQASNPEQNMRIFSDTKSLQIWLESHDFPAQESTVLIKGSHGTGLHQVVKQLQQRSQHVI